MVNDMDLDVSRSLAMDVDVDVEEKDHQGEIPDIEPEDANDDDLEEDNDLHLTPYAEYGWFCAERARGVEGFDTGFSKLCPHLSSPRWPSLLTCGIQLRRRRYLCYCRLMLVWMATRRLCVGYWLYFWISGFQVGVGGFQSCCVFMPVVF
jgi:hypothetical protein